MRILSQWRPNDTESRNRPGVVRVMVTSAITGASLLGQRDGCGAEANFYLFPIIAFIALYLTITSKLYKFDRIV